MCDTFDCSYNANKFRIAIYFLFIIFSYNYKKLSKIEVYFLFYNNFSCENKVLLIPCFAKRGILKRRLNFSMRDWRGRLFRSTVHWHVVFLFYMKISGGLQ